MIAKYFATSFAMLKVVSAPRVMSICFPISTIWMSFVGFESRSTMLPASFAACVPEFMATATSAWARAGASLVPSPVIATGGPWPASRGYGELHLRGGLGEEVVDTRLGGDGSRGERVVAGYHHGADAHASEFRELLLDAPFTMSFSSTTPSTRAPSQTTSGVRSLAGYVLDDAADLFGNLPASPATKRAMASSAPLRSRRPGMSTPLMRVWALNGTKVALPSSDELGNP